MYILLINNFMEDETSWKYHSCRKCKYCQLDEDMFINKIWKWTHFEIYKANIWSILRLMMKNLIKSYIVSYDYLVVLEELWETYVHNVFEFPEKHSVTIKLLMEVM